MIIEVQSGDWIFWDAKDLIQLLF